MVQSAGTMNGFNFAYCKILYENVLNCLSTDFVYGDGNAFPINERSFGDFQKKVEFVKEYNDNFNHILADEKKQEEWRVVISSTVIRLQKNSLLPILIENISEQLSIEGVRIPSTVDEADQVRSLIDDLSAYFTLVKKYLAMFEY